MLRSWFHPAILVAGLAGLAGPSGCTCEEPAAPETLTPGTTPSDRPSDTPVCTPLPPVDSWRPVRAEFFEARLPASFREAEIDEGKGYRDDAAKRRIQLSPIDLPLGGLHVGAAIDKLDQGVRAQAKAPELGLKLGPTHRGGTEAEPLRYHRVTAPDRSFVQGMVGRAMPDGRLHAVLIIFEDEGARPECMQRDARALMETVSIPTGALASASASVGPVAPAPPVRFTTLAREELGRQVRPGETVWVGVTRQGAEFSYVLDVGAQVPPSADAIVVDGIPVAVDRASRRWLQGTTIDFVPGRGFVFRQPD